MKNALLIILISLVACVTPAPKPEAPTVCDLIHADLRASQAEAQKENPQIKSEVLLCEAPIPERAYAFVKLVDGNVELRVFFLYEVTNGVPVYVGSQVFAVISHGPVENLPPEGEKGQLDL